MNILRIDTAARADGSVSRRLTDRMIAGLGSGHALITRDLATGIPQIDADWVAANFTPADQRSETQQEALALSDTLIAEVVASDLLVIGLPVYNFGVPAALKAWIDQVARAGVTFRYTQSGPEGLLRGKSAVILYASGGTPVGSEIDFASGYLRHVLGFMGITDVTLIAADRLIVDPDAATHAEQSVDRLATSLVGTAAA